MLKSINRAEVEYLAEEFRSLIGARLQEVRTSEEILGLGFYHQGNLVWILIDLKPSCPMMVLSEEFLPGLKTKSTPVLLFIKAHFVGHRLQNVILPKEGERIIEFHFPERKIEVRLIPHAVNILIEAGDKKISWSKVKELKEIAAIEGRALIVRTKDELFSQWTESKSQKNTKSFDPKKMLEKKEKALAELEKSINSDQGEDLRNKAMQLQASGLFEEAELQYELAKKTDQKKEGTRLRIEVLKKEIESLSSGHFKQKDTPQIENTLVKAQSEGRRLLLFDKYELLLGKSGKDNLNILRKASPHDYWLHLKDYPGAHGVLRVHKKKAIDEAELLNIAQRFIQESKAANRDLREGDLVEVLVVQCRFVRPIKGDKLGRVNYQNERVLRVKFQPK